MPQISDEQMVIFKELLANLTRPTIRHEGPDPSHRGVIDQDYVRGSDVREFPKMAYRESKTDPKGYTTKIIQNENEQSIAVKQKWLVDTKDIHALLEELQKQKSGVAEVAA